MSKPAVFSVVGFQDAGKTQVVEGLVARATKSGHAVAVIKHDGHADTLAETDWEKPTSDTARAARAGARWTMVASRRGWMMHAWNDSANGVDEWIQTLLAASTRSGTSAEDLGVPGQHTGPDIVLVEGMKGSGLPKVVIAKDQDELDSLLSSRLTQVQCVCWTGENKPRLDVEMPLFLLSDLSDLWRFLRDQLGLMDRP